MPDVIRQAIVSASDFVWGPWHTSLGPLPGPLMFLVILVGLYLTVRTGFVQIRRFPEAVRTMIPKASAGAAGALSPLQAFMTALAASIGTGNIAGVATAVIAGGPGALFWIWAYGAIATAIKFAEAVLGISFRVAHAGGSSSGPMYYLRDGLKSRWLAGAYAVIAATAALVTTPFTQPNSMAVVLDSEFGIPRLASGLVIMVLTWLVVIGGVGAIGKAAEKLSPLKVGLYLAGGLFVILTHASAVPGVIALVFREALSFRAAAGSSLGIGIIVAMRYGVARGIYANEAGYGTAAVAYGTARSAHPTQQGLNAVMEVFIVSFVTSSISALTILVSGVAQQSIDVLRRGGDALNSTAAVAAAFNTSIPVVGGWVVAFCSFLFGYTTLIGWAYYGEQFLEYLFGTRIAKPYRWVYCLLIPLGATTKVETVWAWGDLMNGLQVIPNLIGLVGLSGIVALAARARTGDRG